MLSSPREVAALLRSPLALGSPTAKRWRVAAVAYHNHGFVDTRRFRDLLASSLVLGRAQWAACAER